MAATSTNKQPLLVDRVLHYVVDLNLAAVGAIDVIGTNTAVLIVDATSSDGCIIEDIYALSRSSVEHKINLYLSSSFDYLRPNEGVFIGQLKSGTSEGAVTHWEEMPRVLAPMPHAGSEGQFQALYIPKGKALWAGREDVAALNDGPLLGCQGGWY